MQPETALHPDLPTVAVGGFPIAGGGMAEALHWYVHQVEQRVGVSVRFVNAFSVVSAHRNRAYRTLMRQRGVSLPDGVAVVAALNLLAPQRRAQQVRGPSFFEQALARTEHLSVRHFLLGGTPEMLDALEGRITGRWPGLQVAGTHAPAFGPVDDALIADAADRIRRSGANCVWVALGTPKQDLLADRLATETGVPCLAVGAAFDFLAGTKAEAPRWMRKAGLEWMFRLVTEPRRLWRRYLIGNIAFVLLVLRHGHRIAR